MSKDEVRVVDPKTGGEKGSKTARFDLIPPDALWAIAEHYGRGASKYAARNWERGYNWGLSVAALERHLKARMMGEKVDAETGSLHLTAVAWHALALLTFELRGLGTDDITVNPPVIFPPVTATGGTEWLRSSASSALVGGVLTQTTDSLNKPSGPFISQGTPSSQEAARLGPTPSPNTLRNGGGLTSEYYLPTGSGSGGAPGSSETD